MKRTIAEEINDYNNTEEYWNDVLYTHLNTLGEPYKYIIEKDYNNCEQLETNHLQNKNITEIGILYEIVLNHFNHTGKKNNGVYYTPEDAADFMAQHYTTFFNNPEGVWLDPCCGTGNLTQALLRNLPKHINKEEFLLNNMRCMDIDATALKTARTLLTITYQKEIPDLYNRIQQNFHHMNYLDTNLNNDDNSLFHNNSMEIKYDYVIMNPPYVSKVKDNRYKTNKCGNYYAYFMENAAKNSKGFISITPQSYTNSRKFEPLREILLEQNNNMNVYVYDNIPDSIFKGRKIGVTNSNTNNSVRASITTWKKTEEDSSFKITPMLRWKATEREKIFTESVKQLTELENVSKTIFPKIHKELLNYYNNTGAMKLGEIVSRTSTEYVLYVPSTPRYYITATRKTLNRSSMVTLFFNNEKDYDHAYLLLNSYIPYFYWRTLDGGMTLSKTTLLDIPFIDYVVGDPITIQNNVSSLLNSEDENLVVKVNAGKEQENIKHSSELRRSLTKLFVSNEDEVNVMEQTTRNSIFT